MAQVPRDMNWEQMKKNVGCRVQLIPPACRLDENGRELPPKDDDWIIQEVSTAGVRVSNTRTDHHTTLGKDHIHHFTSNPDRSQTGVQHGFLTLNVQLFLQGNRLWVRPNARPGEPVMPQLGEAIEKREPNLQFVEHIGIYVDRETQLHVCPLCLSQKKPSFLKNESHGFRCTVCGSYFRDPKRKRNEEPTKNL